MKKQLTADVVMKKKPDGKIEIFIGDPQSMREIHTGLHCFAQPEAVKTMLQIKNQLERAGNHVRVFSV